MFENFHKSNPINAGKEIYIVIGTTDKITLKDARAKASEFFASVQRGINPMSPEKARKPRLTLRMMFEAWIEHEKRNTRWTNPTKTIRDMKTRLQYLREVCEMSANTITTKDIADAIEPIWREHQESSMRICRNIRSAYAWAIRQKMISRSDNPSDVECVKDFLGHVEYQKANHPALSVSEIPDFFHDLICNRFSVSSLFVAFSILTVARTGAILETTWDDIKDGLNGKIHLIPRERMKVKDGTMFDRKTPLSREALWVLDKVGIFPVKSPYVFPNREGGHIGAEAYYKALNRLHASRLKENGIGWVDPNQKEKDGSARRITVHGTSRATFKTWALNHVDYKHKEFSTAIIEACLDHKDKYNNAYYREAPEGSMREVLDAWGAYCFSKITEGDILTPKDAMYL